jgi:prophage tail gpP-like protein
MMQLRINNKLFNYFLSVDVTLKFATVGSTFTFDAYFDTNNEEHKQIFKPFSYNKAEIIHNNEVILTGVMLNNSSVDNIVKEKVTINGYSKTGVLEDCEIPTTLYPLQSDKRSLKEITERLIKPFGLTLIVDPAVLKAATKVYSVTTANEKQSIKAYLTELATQRNIIFTNTAKGELLLTIANISDKPVINIKDTTNKKMRMTLVTNGQKMHSIITAQKQADEFGDNGGESSIENPYGKAAFRPKVKTQSSGDDIATADVVKNLLATELKNIKLVISFEGWTWLVNGLETLIEVNTIISVQSDELYLFKKTNFFIESVQFIGDNKTQTTTITCVLPEVYNGGTPKNIFE